MTSALAHLALAIHGVCQNTEPFQPQTLAGSAALERLVVELYACRLSTRDIESGFRYQQTSAAGSQLHLQCYLWTSFS
jgi:hypothetical protein